MTDFFALVVRWGGVRWVRDYYKTKNKKLTLSSFGRDRVANFFSAASIAHRELVSELSVESLLQASLTSTGPAPAAPARTIAANRGIIFTEGALSALCCCTVVLWVVAVYNKLWTPGGCQNPSVKKREKVLMVPMVRVLFWVLAKNQFPYLLKARPMASRRQARREAVKS